MNDANHQYKYAIIVEEVNVLDMTHVSDQWLEFIQSFFHLFSVIKYHTEEILHFYICFIIEYKNAS